MSFTPTKEQLEELWFYEIHEWTDDWREKYIWSYVWNSWSKYPIYIAYTDNEFELWLTSFISNVYPKSIEDIQTLIRLLSPNN